MQFVSKACEPWLTSQSTPRFTCTQHDKTSCRSACGRWAATKQGRLYCDPVIAAETMPSCCRGAECEFSHAQEVWHHCLTCPPASNRAHAAWVEVRQEGMYKVVQVGLGDGQPPTDTRYLPATLLSAYGRLNISRHEGGDGGSRGNARSKVCKSCWNRHARSEAEPEPIQDPICCTLFRMICSWAIEEGNIFVWVYSLAMWNLT